MVWAVFAVVVTVRILFPPEPVEPAPRWEGREPAEQPEFNRGPGRWGQRPPTRVAPPVAEVPTDLWRIRIEIEPADAETLRGYQWRGWGGRRQEPQERPEVKATVREGGMVYTNVSLHLKGAAGSFRRFDDKPALTLNFSSGAPGRLFHGFSKISLNNSVQDPSYLCEAICREMFEAAGVPVPQAGHATVLINGRDLGLYVLTEGWGKTFLRRHFRNASGRLYDGGFVQDITGRLEINSGEKTSDRSDLDRLAEAASEPDLARRVERLHRVLDWDRFITLTAMEVMMCHWDGYALNRNNYRLYHDPDTDRMVFMPHGLDQMFGVARSSPTSPIDPGMRGMVAQAVVETPEGHREFLERIVALRRRVFIEEKLTNRVHQLSQRIRPTLAAYGPEIAAEHDAYVEDLCQRIVERARSISEQLGAIRAGPAQNKE